MGTELRTIGIVGAYGETGTVVARELAERPDVRLLVGGRDIIKARRLAEDLNRHALAVHVDVEDSGSLHALCQASDVVVNCAAPCSSVGASVALSCLETRTDYVDPGLYAVLEPALARRADELRAKRLRFVSSAGEFPGLTEIVPLYAEAWGRDVLDTIDRVVVYAADRNEWSPSAVQDILWSIGNSDEPGFYEQGEWRARNPMTQLRAFRFPHPVGRVLVVPHYKPELRRFATDRQYPAIGAYVGGYSVRTLLLFAWARALNGRRQEQAARRIGRAISRDARSRGHGLAIVGVVQGTRDGQPCTVTATVSENQPTGYRITGLMAATATKLLLDDRTAGPGHRPLCDAVDPKEFVAAIETSGVNVEITEGVAA